MSELATAVRNLTVLPKTLAVATGPEGLPGKPGLYAWWTMRGSIPGVPRCPHPSEPGLDLFYVGISPSSASSSQNLRKRVGGNHIKGNTGGSTFRLTLASLLFEAKDWKPLLTDRPMLSREDNAALTAWQHKHLRLTWAVHPEPWTIEDEVIAHLKPPLNLAGSAHEFGSTVTAARRRFKETAEGGEKTSRSAEIRQEPTWKKGAQRMGTITLHEEIADVLAAQGGRWMTTTEIAEAVAERGRYLKRDGTSDVTDFQVHGRTKNYPDLFERDGSRVRLKTN